MGPDRSILRGIGALLLAAPLPGGARDQEPPAEVSRPAVARSAVAACRQLTARARLACAVAEELSARRLRSGWEAGPSGSPRERPELALLLEFCSDLVSELAPPAAALPTAPTLELLDATDEVVERLADGALLSIETRLDVARLASALLQGLADEGRDPATRRAVARHRVRWLLHQRPDGPPADFAELEVRAGLALRCLDLLDSVEAGDGRSVDPRSRERLERWSAELLRSPRWRDLPPEPDADPRDRAARRERMLARLLSAAPSLDEDVLIGHLLARVSALRDPGEEPGEPGRDRALDFLDTLELARAVRASAAVREGGWSAFLDSMDSLRLEVVEGELRPPAALEGEDAGSAASPRSVAHLEPGAPGLAVSVLDREGRLRGLPAPAELGLSGAYPVLEGLELAIRVETAAGDPVRLCLRAGSGAIEIALPSRVPGDATLFDVSLPASGARRGLVALSHRPWTRGELVGALNAGLPAQIQSDLGGAHEEVRAFLASFLEDPRGPEGPLDLTLEEQRELAIAGMRDPEGVAVVDGDAAARLREILRPRGALPRAELCERIEPWVVRALGWTELEAGPERVVHLRLDEEVEPDRRYVIREVATWEGP